MKPLLIWNSLQATLELIQIYLSYLLSTGIKVPPHSADTFIKYNKNELLEKIKTYKIQALL